jgi:hypothetical protein
MRALLLSPDNSVELDIELPDPIAQEAQVVLCGGQVFHKVPAPLSPDGNVPSFRQVPFISLDPPTQQLAEALAIAGGALKFVKAFFVKLERDLPKTDPLRRMREKFHAPVHAHLDNGIAIVNEALGIEPEPEKPEDEGRVLIV